MRIAQWEAAGYEHAGDYAIALIHTDWDDAYDLLPVGSKLRDVDEVYVADGVSQRWVSIGQEYPASVGEAIEPSTPVCRRKKPMSWALPPADPEEDPQVKEHKALMKFFATPAGKWPGFLGNKST